MRKLVVFIFFFVFILSHKISFAQKIVSAGREVNFTNYNSEDGVAGSVYNIFQDSKGHLYACTVGGLAVFDGKVFNNYTSADGLPTSNISSVCEDNSKNIWIGSWGLSVLIDGKFKNYDSLSGFDNNRRIWCIFKDTDGTMWAGAEKIYHFDPKNIKKPFIKSYNVSKAKNPTGIRCIMRKKDGTLIAGGESDHFILKADSFIASESPGACYSLIEMDNGIEWTCGWGNPVREFKNGKLINNFDLGSGVLKIIKDKNGNVWIATWDKGIFKYDGEKFINYTTKEGLLSNSFWCVYEDREGNIWFGNWGGGGITKYSGEKFTSITEKYGLLNNYLINIVPDKDGNLWISGQYGVNKYDVTNKTITKIDSFNGKGFNKIINESIDQKNTIWLTGYTDYQYTIENNKITDHHFPGGFCMFHDTNGDKWLGSDNHGGIRIRGDSIKEFRVKNAGLNRVVKIYKDKKGNFWFVNIVKGINFYDGTKTINFSRVNGLFNKQISAVGEDGLGNYWFTVSEMGLYKAKLINNSSIELLDSLNVTEGFPTKSISPPVYYNGKMYFTTGLGLCVMDSTEYSKGNKKFIFYSKQDGFIKDGSTLSYIDKNGVMWFTTSKGVYCFDPKLDVKNKIETINHIYDLRLFFEKADWNLYSRGYNGEGLPEKLELPYDKNHLTFDFIGICLTAPEKVLYQFKLQGLDKDWSPITDKQEAVFSNIPPGTYTFMVKSCNNDGVWNQQPTSFVFKIVPPFWRRTWFYFLIGTILIGLFYFYVRFREQKLQKEKAILENKVNERTSQLNDAYKNIEEKNKDITDSINYAKKIQEALLPAKEIKYEIFPNAFVLFNPRDIVSGDFYWFTSQNGKRIITAVDCTGHGVPGAFMSMIGNTFLNEIIEEKEITEPGMILSELRHMVIKSLKQDGVNAESKDGMDMSLLAFNEKNTVVEYAGANNPLWIIRNGQCIEYTADKRPIGFYRGQGLPFTNHKIDIQKGDTLYIFTDGYADQFGGPKGKKFKYKQFQEILLSIQNETMLKQEEILLSRFNEWKGNLEQVDDVLVIGVRI